MTTRRNFIIATTAFAGLGVMGARAAGSLSGKLGDEFARIEGDSGGRLGVVIRDTSTQEQIGHHADDLFPMCSTFKMLAAAAVLQRVDAGKDRLDRRVAIAAGDILEYAPVTKNHVGGEGMTLAELCEAAVTLSDNTAGNLMLASFGGPQGLTAFARSIGDTVTRLDRTEPTLNEAIPGDPRDTTTPAAMVKNMHALLLGDVLSASSRALLTKWLVANKTGDQRLRAGLPAGWRCGDKTASGERGTSNDVAIIWPPQRAPILVAVYLTDTSADTAKRNAVFVAISRAVANAITG